MQQPLIVPAPHQSDQALAQQLTGLARELGLPSSAIATDTGGPRVAYRVATELYDAWLIEMGAIPAAPEPVALPAQDSSAAATAAAGDDSAGAGVEGSVAPAVSTTTKKKQSGKAASR
jgi:hypothetical protein